MHTDVSLVLGINPVVLLLALGNEFWICLVHREVVEFFGNRDAYFGLAKTL